MSKRKFGFEGFSINRQPTYNFERSQAPQRLYAPAHDNHEDHDLDNIDYAGDHSDAAADAAANPSTNDDEIDPLDAFMEGIQEEIRCSSVVELRKEEGEGGREAWGSMDLAVIVVSPTHLGDPEPSDIPEPCFL